MAIVSFRYPLLVGLVPEVVAGNLFRTPWLIVHATAAATALLVAPLQFWSSLRARRPALHRWIGRTYVAACSIGGVTGFVLALGASTGPTSTAGFGALAIAWTAATLTGWSCARQRRFAEHRAWMMRSFALTFAAVTLRVYLPLLALLPLRSRRAIRPCRLRAGSRTCCWRRF